MSGFLIFLLIAIGVILLFVFTLSVPLHISFSYTDKIYLSVRYAFIKLDLLPIDPNKKKKEKKPKKEKQPKAEKKKKEPPTKEKKPNPIIQMIGANGYDGMMEILGNLGRIFKSYGGKLFKSVVFDQIEIYINVGTGDAASTAIKYGQACQKVYPLLGFICSNNVVGKYEAVVEPDFLANYSQGEVYIELHAIIRKIVNSTIGAAFGLVFKVALKFLRGAKKNKETAD